MCHLKMGTSKEMLLSWFKLSCRNKLDLLMNVGIIEVNHKKVCGFSVYAAHDFLSF